jgi:hypothetical protein
MSAALDSQVIGTVRLAGIDGYHFLGDDYTVERKCAFISLYREHGSIYHAAKLTPVSRKTVYNWIEVDEQFAEAVADSKEDSLDDLETSVYQRAFKDSILAMFYLKAHRPKFRDKVTIDIEAVNEEIRERMRQLNSSSAQLANPLQFPPQSSTLQKEDKMHPGPIPTPTTTD